MPPFNFGDFLPLEDRENLADEHLGVGSVFKFFCKKANKEKRLILVGFSYNKIHAALVHINTEINPLVFRTPALKDEHLPIDYDGSRPYLDHDSFINCSDFIIEEIDDIRRLLVANTSVHLGNLNDTDLKRVKAKIAKSKVLRTDRKKEYGCFFP